MFAGLTAFFTHFPFFHSNNVLYATSEDFTVYISKCSYGMNYLARDKLLVSSLLLVLLFLDNDIVSFQSCSVLH